MKKQSLAIVISLAKSHVHYCKALIASIEHYGIKNPVIIFKDGDFNLDSISQRKNVTVLSTEELNACHDFNLRGLLNKINICFLPEMGFDYDYYLHMDADSIITSQSFKSVIESSKSDFSILQGKQVDYLNSDIAKVFDNFAFVPSTFENTSFDLKNMWYFSSGHFIVNKTLINPLKSYLKVYRNELNTGFSKDTRFKFGDQGFFNFVVNVLSYEGTIDVSLINDGIYGKEKAVNHNELTLDNVVKKRDTGVDFIHYTGPSRKANLKSHNFGDILHFFNKSFYTNNFSFYLHDRIRICNYYLKWYEKRLKNKFKTLTK
ncbi:hypothetical protein AB9K26_06005 [Psychroserpens sp. XS_ASV72]|uniref:hypothetical protein n=1 Tax=Psychroserpens sp. XS_ASV72 TaxID=3241293 RepID=UPI003517CFD1